jgi:hypothetical protein
LPLHKTIKHRNGGVVVKRILLLVAMAACLAQTATVAILDTQVRNETGAMFTGDITVTSTAVTPPDSITLVPTGITVKVVNGRASSALYTGVYHAVYVGARKTATWTVPTTGPVTIRAIETIP